MYISRGLLVTLVTCVYGVVAIPQGPVKGPKAAVKELLSATDEKTLISLSPSASSKLLEYASRSSDVPQAQATKVITNIITSDQGEKSGSLSKRLRKFFTDSSEKASSNLSNRSGSKSVEVRDYLLPDPEHPSKPWVGHWRSAQIEKEQREKEKTDKKAAKEAAKKQKYEDKKKKHDDKKKEQEDRENGVRSAVDFVESGIVPRAAANTSVSTPTLSRVTEPVIKSASSSLWHKFFGKETEAEKEEAAKKRQEKKDAAKKADEDWEEDYKKQRHEDFLSEVSVLFNPKTKKPQARAAATISSIPLPTSSKNLSQPAVTAPSPALLALVDGKKSEAQLEGEKNRPKQPYPTAYSNLARQNFSKIVTRAVDVGMEKRAPAPHKVKTTMATKTRGWSPSLSAAVSSRIYQMRHRTPEEILKDRKKLEKEQLVKLAPEKPLNDLDKWIQEEENKHQPANGYAKWRRLLF